VPDKKSFRLDANLASGRKTPPSWFEKRGKLEQTAPPTPDRLRTQGMDGYMLHGWRPDLDDLDHPPRKRARMAATTLLYRQLCAQVSGALREREKRDQHERAASRELARRYPLAFCGSPDSAPAAPACKDSDGKENGAQALSSPLMRKTSDSAQALSCKVTPNLLPKKTSAPALSDLVLEDCLRVPPKGQLAPVSTHTLRTVGSEANLDEVSIPRLPSLDADVLMC